MSMWTVDFLLLLPIFLSLGVLYYWIYRKKREGRKFPFSDPVLRVPGQGLSHQIDEISFDMATYFGLIPLPIITAYAIYLQHLVTYERPLTPLYTAILFVIALAMMMYLLFLTIKLLNKRLYCRLGYAGGVAVGGALNELMLQGYHVFHDVQGDNQFNIDHLVVGPTGMFAIETKTKIKLTKRVQSKDAYKVNYDGNALYFPDKPDNPHKEFLNQAERGAKWVSKWLSEAMGVSVYAQAVLAMPGWFITIKKPGRVLVLNHKQIHAITQVRKSQLDKTQITQIAYQIKQKCQHDSLVPEVFRK